MTTTIDTHIGGDVFSVSTSPKMTGFVLVEVNEELCTLSTDEARALALALIEAANRG